LAVVVRAVDARGPEKLIKMATDQLEPTVTA